MSVAIAFGHRHRGHTDEAIAVELSNLRVEAFGETPRSEVTHLDPADARSPTPCGQRDVYFDSERGFQRCRIYQRQDLSPGHCIRGPAVVAQRDTTTLVLPGQAAAVSQAGVLRINIRGAT